MQATGSRASGQGIGTAQLVATVFAIPAAVIVVAAVDGSDLPVIGTGVSAIVVLFVIATVMCARGIVAMQGRFGAGAFLIGTPLGIVALALVVSGIFGWSPLLRPIADAMGPSVTLQRAAIVGVGAIMALKWAIAWTSYLPRPR